MALATVAQVKAYVPGITGSDLDSLITTLIEQVGDSIIDDIGHNIESDTYTLVFDGDGVSNDILVPQFPIQSITSLKQDTTGDFSYDTTLTANTDYTYIAKRGLVRLASGSTFSKGRYNYQLIYTAGYDTVPAPIAFACIQLVALHLQLRAVHGRTSVDVNDATTKFSHEIPAHIRSKYSKYIDSRISINMPYQETT